MEKEKLDKKPSVIVSKIVFNDGTEIDLDEDDVVIFVGPNNAGKSRILKEIRNSLNQYNDNKIVLKEVEYKERYFNKDTLYKYFEDNYLKDEFGNYIVRINENYTCSFNQSNFDNLSAINNIFYKAFYSFLSTEDRLAFSSPNRFIKYDIQKVFNALTIDEKAIQKLNKYLYTDFEKSVDVFHDLEKNIKTYKIGTKDEIHDTINSRGRKSYLLLKNMLDLEEQGDGIRGAFSILSIFSIFEHSIFLVDEPETFLHPPQARLLGNNIMNLSEDKQVFISTHNIDLIKGLLEKKTTRIKIIKINRIDNKNIISLLDNKLINKISNDKNLKYTNILNGLFYKKVVICEDEADCKFYSSILEYLDDKLYHDILFCAVGGKDQFKKIVPLLKNLSIDFLIIGDLDLINDRKKLKDLLNCFNDNEYNKIKKEHDKFLTDFEEKVDCKVKTQSEIKKLIDDYFTASKYITEDTIQKIKDVLKSANSLKQLKEYGVSAIPAGECRMLFEKIKDELELNHIYMPNCGEMECFIKTINSHGNIWVEKVFEMYPKLDNEVYKEAKDFIKRVFKIN